MTSQPELSKLPQLLQQLADSAAQPAEQARSMPPAVYTSEAFLALEHEAMFRSEWVCLGHAGQIPRPGDYFSCTVAGEPLLVVRGDEGQVRVLSNVCRHRANLIAQGRGHRQRLVCSYHAWSYDRGGRLLHAPLMEEAAARQGARCDLPVFATELWQDFIFVNLDGQAAPLGPRLAAFLPAINNYGITGRHHQFVGEEVWHTNWKCLVENFMEGYHLSAAHAKTLHAITPTALCRKIAAPPGMTAYTAGYAPSVPERGPYPEALSAQERRYSVLFSVFPNLMVSVAPNVTLYLLVQPVDADHVGIQWGLLGTIADPQHPDVIRYRELCESFNLEDRAQLEAVQQGLKSRHYHGGPLAPSDFEGTVWDFHQYVAARILNRQGS
jgi:phenylpropionate dioxygenase-like ring-hydroxylating dioxygenase large terminal subunit